MKRTIENVLSFKLLLIFKNTKVTYAPRKSPRALLKIFNLILFLLIYRECQVIQQNFKICSSYFGNQQFQTFGTIKYISVP